MVNQLPNKLPPQSIEAEQSVLGCLMIDKATIIRIADFLKPEDFYKKSHQEIYKVCLKLFEKDEAIDFLAVSNKLKEKGVFEEIGGNAYLTELINTVPTPVNAFNYAKIVSKKRVLRDLIDASYEIGQLGYEEEEETDTLLDRAERKIFSIAQKSLSQDFILVKDDLEEAFERIDQLSKHKGGLRGLASGLPDLDNILAGFQKSDLLILAARPSLGKSALALNFAYNIAVNQKIPVGIFSLEMSKDQVIDRLISSISGVDLWRLRTGRLSSEGEDNDFTRIQQSLAVLSDAPIYIHDSLCSNVLQMKAMSRRLQSKKGLGLIIIDYLQLMEPMDIKANPVQQVSENSRALKSLARELNIPVLVVSQLSRAVEQRSPQIPRLADLRQSGCLTGDTLISRADNGEQIPIKELVGKSDIPIFALGHDYKLHIRKMTKVFYSGKKMVYELKTRSGRKIKASANHPFWKTSGWTRLDELKVGDCIATPKELKISAAKNELLREEIILLAHLLGDGCILPRQPYHYTNTDQENIKVVAETAAKLFGIKPKIVKQKNWWHVYLTSPRRLTHGKYHPITEWYKSLEIKRVRSWEKKIPQKVFSLDNEHLALFLKHLWATDGSITLKPLRNKRTQCSIYYSTTSHKLAIGVKHLLLRFGIRSKISEKRKESYRICYTVSIYGKEHQLNFFEKIGCFGKRGRIIPQLIEKLNKIKSNTILDVWPKETWQFIINPLRKEQGISWRDFSAGINTTYCGTALLKHGIGMERMQRIAQYLQSPLIVDMAQANIFWDEIVSIKPLCVQKVYDATVTGLHNFVANGIIVENSIEQDADVVMFIYKEDRYRPETSRKNIADLIIAKHRNGPVGRVELYFDEGRVRFRSLEKTFEE
ncbi:MAG: replicative DNA helicase [Candidatus Nealsonbacteria bacterium]